ncbi:MAG: 3'(2'),5'-bisphosphate nucleotidase CysQ [Gammaproteobacteria bacterium]|nr:3'(2'),5'-bisphosphate nucleotidase CysQ [Gammaproteobacteria bacterium]
MSFDPCRSIDAVEQTALEAGRRILAVYAHEFGVTAKGDGSPVTAADDAAQAVIVERLTQLTPQIPILSEEAASVDYADRAGWTRFWLVDPLDGTKEFISRNGEFTVNIALIEHGEPVLGVVHVPVNGVTYLACRGFGAFKRQGAGAPIAIRAQHYDGRRPRVVASRSHADASLQDYLTRVGEHDLVSMGSSLKFCLVAEGMADVYPRLGPTMEWDTGAAQCIVEVAGGRVVDPDGAPLRYNKPSLRNPWLIASGAGGYDWNRYLAAG